MSLDDESLISAYLDDQLDPQSRFAVEAALATSPELFEKLRSLEAVRALVGGLSHPAPDDLSLLVQRRLEGRGAGLHGRRAIRLSEILRSRRAIRIAGLASAAAVLIAFLLLSPAGRRHQVDDRDPVAGPIVAPTGELTANKATEAPLVSKLPAAPIAGSRDEAAHGDGAGDTDAGPAQPTPPVAFTSRGEPTAQDRVRALLDNPRLRRIFIVTDVVGDPAESRVASLLERSTRRDYFKLTVAQGIMIDPRHPGEATVFATVLDDDQLAKFRERLVDQLKDRVSEEDVSPRVTTLLADIGEVATIPPEPSSEVKFPRHEIAIRHERQETTGVDPDVQKGQTLAELHGPTEPIEAVGPSPSMPGRDRDRKKGTVPGSAALAGAGRDERNQPGSRRTGPSAGPLNTEDSTGLNSPVILVWIAHGSPSGR